MIKVLRLSIRELVEETKQGRLFVVGLTVTYCVQNDAHYGRVDQAERLDVDLSLMFSLFQHLSWT